MGSHLLKEHVTFTIVDKTIKWGGQHSSIIYLTNYSICDFPGSRLRDKTNTCCPYVQSTSVDQQIHK